MNRNDLFRSFSEIDDLTLIETEAYKKRKSNHVILGLIAASLAIVLLISAISHLFPADNPNQTPSSWFVITAQAAEGDWNELDLNDGYFNSCGTNQSISLFPVDMPLFNFVIKPSDWGEYRNEYGKFSIEVSYNGKLVDTPDTQVVVFHVIPLYGSNAPYEYHVTGWIEEPTDITITIIDNSTGNLVEEITVNVEPQQGNDLYKLTVTNIETHNI